MTTNYTYQKEEVSDGCRGYIVICLAVAAAVAIFLWGVIKWVTVYW